MGGCGQSSHWRILKISFPPLRLYGLCGAKICLKTTDPGLVSILTAQNYCNFSKLPTFYLLICIVFIPKACLTPPPNLDLHQPLVLFLRQSCNGNNAILVGKASSLLPSSPRVFCPLLSSSVLFPFFGKPSGWRILLLPDRLQAFTGTFSCYSFSSWQNSSELSFTHGLSKALLLKFRM